MWDAWAAFDPAARGYLFTQNIPTENITADRNEAISYAALRILTHRFQDSPGAATSLPSFAARMGSLGFDSAIVSTTGDTPAEVGNRIAAGVIAFGMSDGANEANQYVNQHYLPVNPPLVPALEGNPDLVDPNRWQPLALDFFIDQGGNVILGGFPEFLSPEWGHVRAFALSPQDRTIYTRDNFDYHVYHDPGPPPELGSASSEYYKWGFEMVAAWSSHLDPSDGVLIDISPASLGNAPLADPDEYESYYDFENGGDWGTGHALNPHTGQPYSPQIVARADYARVLAEFWADGPDSETPPGHWFVIANYVSDHSATQKRIGGTGPTLNDLEWDVKLYFMMSGAMHDCAVTAWGVKGWYDYIRPVSALRHLADLGQSSDPSGFSYHPDGITLRPGLIELVTHTSTLPGERHAHLAGHEGKIALWAWKGPDYIANPSSDEAGVGWILAGDWWPYQRPSFVTPPFAGYVSGHSTYSRAGAVVLSLFTGSPFFPGGVGQFQCPQNQFLVFEDGPSQSITLQWATYNDASDQTSLSRIWGGIHPPADDIPGRHMGQQIGHDAVALAMSYFEPVNVPAISAGGMVVLIGLFVLGLVTVMRRSHA
jgi:hypothetical protein